MIFDENYIKSFNTILKESTDNILSENTDFSILNENFDAKREFIKVSKIIRKGTDKSANVVKAFLYKIYKQTPEQMASDVPTIGQLFNLVLIVGIPMYINPLLGCFTILANKIASDAAVAKDIDKAIDKYEKEIEKTESKLMNASKNNKKYLERHLSDLKYGLDVLYTKQSNLNDDGFVKNEASDILQLFETEISFLTEQQFNLLFEDDIISEAGGIKHAKKVMSQKQRRMDKWFDDTVKFIRGEKSNKKREEIISNSLPALSKMVKRAIGLGIAWAINPAIAAIGLVTAMGIDKRATEVEKKKILSELKKELEIVEEKIKDADGSGDRNEKYQLMRLKQKIETDIDKIKRYI